MRRAFTPLGEGLEIFSRELYIKKATGEKDGKTNTYIQPGRRLAFLKKNNYFSMLFCIRIGLMVLKIKQGLFLQPFVF